MPSPLIPGAVYLEHGNDQYGKDAESRHRAEISDDYIAELARKRDETRARTLAPSPEVHRCQLRH